MVVKDRLLVALAAEERRIVCRYLRSRDGPITIEELVAVLAAEAGDPDRGTSIDERETDRMRVGLRHHHLPKLDGADLVEYDPGREFVEPGPALPNAEPVLDVLDEFDAVRSRM